MLKLTSYKEEVMFDILFVSLLSGLISGRIGYVATNYGVFSQDYLRIILFNAYPGVEIFGFLAGFFTVCYLTMNIKKVKFENSIDYFIPPLFLALAIGKIGSFFAGTEIGTVTSFPLSIIYANHDEYRHLTPLYESLVLFLGTFFSHRILFSMRRGIVDKKINFGFFWWYTAVTYLVFDFIKDSRVEVYGWSLVFLISCVVVIISSFMLIFLLRKKLFFSK